jgi:hypothetical protein
LFQGLFKDATYAGYSPIIPSANATITTTNEKSRLYNMSKYIRNT